MNKSVIHILSLIYLLNCFILGSANAASMSDLDKEKRWEEQIVDSIMVGEDVKLKAGSVDFLALYTEPTTDKDKGAVILLHGLGVHPAWPDVIEPLRMRLPDLGWHTLSLQMPVLENEAKETDYSPLFPEVPLRIQAGVDFLKEKGINNIVLSGHSLGATMASFYLSSNRDPIIKRFVILSGGPGLPDNKQMDSLENFRKMKGIDIADIYGSEDLKYVLDTVQHRKVFGKQQFGKHYRNYRVEGANHFYRDKESELIHVISEWLN